jgi:hypothetical protein
MLGRLIADYLARDLKQPAFVQNKGGAPCAIGAEAAVHSEPDGYTLFFPAGSIIVALNRCCTKNSLTIRNGIFRILALVTDLPMDDGGQSLNPRQRRSRSSWSWRNRIPENSISARPEPAVPFITPAKCSSRWPGSG